MAITRADYEIFRRLRETDAVPPRPSLLEIGEAEFYGDVPIDELLRDLGRYVPEDSRHGLAAHVQRLATYAYQGRSGAHHGLAKAVYRMFFAPCFVDAIDLHGTGGAAKMDLNWPANEPIRRDIVYNTGTAEHVFRIGGVLEFVHNATAPGGLMIHCFPFTGLIDHGFYSIQPTLIRDLAEANGYEVLAWAVSAIGGPLIWIDVSRPLASCIDYLHELAKDRYFPDNAWHHVAFRKTPGEGFRVPRQAVYGDAPTAATLADWKAMR